MKKTLKTLTVLLATAALAGTLAAQQGRGTGKGRWTAPDRSWIRRKSPTSRATSFHSRGSRSGMPTLVLNVGGQEQSFVLGSYRYLAAQNFAPAAGDRLHLTLWACASCPQGNVVAAIENVRTGDVLKLRAADGVAPLRRAARRARDAGCGRLLQPGRHRPEPGLPYHSTN